MSKPVDRTGTILYVKYLKNIFEINSDNLIVLCEICFTNIPTILIGIPTNV